MEATPVRKSPPKRKPKATAAVPAPKSEPRPSLKLYRRIAVTFVVFTFLTLAAVVYLSFSRATVHVVSEARAISTTFVADVVVAPVEDTDIQGVVVSNVFEQATEKTIEVGTSTKHVEGKARGMVTIYNKTGKAQPLVATTRLLTPENILFRIDSGVTVPANGSVEVTVHADEPGAAGEIGPGTFTIPGLSVSLQTSIYAESVVAFTGGVEQVGVVTQEDLDAAAEALQAEMIAAARDTLRLEANGTYTGEAFFPEVMEKKSDTPPGTESGVVRISMKLRVIAVFFDQDMLQQIAEAKLYEQVPKGIDLRKTNADQLHVNVDHYDLEAQLANLSVTIAGEGELAATSDVFNKDQMLGKSAGEVERMLESSDAIKDVEIRFTPFWLKRMPTLKDHIRIIVE